MKSEVMASVPEDCKDLYALSEVHIVWKEFAERGLSKGPADSSDSSHHKELTRRYLNLVVERLLEGSRWAKGSICYVRQYDNRIHSV